METIFWHSPLLLAPVGIMCMVAYLTFVICWSSWRLYVEWYFIHWLILVVHFISLVYVEPLCIHCQAFISYPIHLRICQMMWLPTGHRVSIQGGRKREANLWCSQLSGLDPGLIMGRWPCDLLCSSECCCDPWLQGIQVLWCSCCPTSRPGQENIHSISLHSITTWHMRRMWR